MATGCLALSWAGGPGGDESMPCPLASPCATACEPSSLPQASADTLLFVRPRGVQPFFCPAHGGGVGLWCLRLTPSVPSACAQLGLLSGTPFPPLPTRVSCDSSFGLSLPRQVPGADTESPRYLPPLRNTGPSYVGRVWLPGCPPAEPLCCTRRALVWFPSPLDASCSLGSY